jgi:hypothetical protein
MNKGLTLSDELGLLKFAYPNGVVPFSSLWAIVFSYISP